MAPPITLDAGGANLVLPWQRFGRAEPIAIGELSDADDGTTRSSIRAEKMVAAGITTRVTAAIEAQVRAMFALGARVPTVGPVWNNGGATVTVTGKMTSELMPGGDRWVINLTLTQATVP